MTARDNFRLTLGLDSERELNVQWKLIVIDVLGEESDTVLEAFNTLASTILEDKRVKEAGELWQQCLEGRIKLFGREHPKVLAIWNNLGVVSEQMGDYDVAINFYGWCLNTKSKVL